MRRPDGKTAITVVLTEEETKKLHLVMERMYRNTVTDCVRALINEKASSFLPFTFRQRNGEVQTQP